MKSPKQVLDIVEKSIIKVQERSYFWTHEIRYRWILEKIKFLSNGKKLTILDIGCFPYHVGKALELLGHTVYGIASYHEPVSNNNVAVVNIETEKFPYANDFFDLVLCNEVIEHLPQSPIPALREIKRVLKKNGLCMITTPNIARLVNRIKVLVGFSPMYPTDVYFENNGKGNNIYHRHNREYTLSELVKVVRGAGFKIAEEKYFISYTPFRKRVIPDTFMLVGIKFINYASMLFLNPFKDTLCVLGKKD